MKLRIVSSLLALTTLLAAPAPGSAQGTAFTYQGRLNDGAHPANGTYDFQFGLFDAASGGLQQSGTWTQLASAVSNGLFTVTLDFGDFFPGAERWLELGVRTNGGGAFTPLTPRQKFTATPYAILSGSLVNSGAALTNVNALSLGGLAAADFWKLSGNAGTTPGAEFLGTTDNLPLEIKVNGIRALRLEPTANGTPNFIAGAANNSVAAGVFGVAISGGANNQADAGSGFATISGGQLNAIQAGGAESSIGGGYRNTIATFDATIGGGAVNTIETASQYATIGGGTFNRILAGAALSTIGGGSGNLVESNAPNSVIPGGVLNTAGGPFSFAAGRRAKAMHQGGFVWADSQDADFTSTASNQFLIRAAGGVGINNSIPNGAALAVNGYVTVEGTIYANALSAGSVTTPEVITPKISTAGNVPLDFYVNGGRALRLEQSANSVNVIGGWPFNDVAAGVLGATVWGGGYWFTAGSNSVAANFGTVSGGRDNFVLGEHGTVSGGRQNSANNAETTVAGGRANIANGGNATISGGFGNFASGAYAAVAGGRENYASGEGSLAMGVYATASGLAAVALGYSAQAAGTNSVALGYYPNAWGDYAMALGTTSYASHRGSFVWSDTSGLHDGFFNGFQSTSSNQFLVRATGGVGINMNNPQSTLHVNGTARIQGANNWGVSGGEGDFRVGNDSYRFKIGVANGGGGAGDIWMRAHGGIERINLKAPGGTRILSNEAESAGVSLAANGTAWAVISDRNIKKDFAAVDSQQILEKLAALPITHWHYQWENADAPPHLGPMAQDFKAAFYPGTDDKSITTQEADGVALAAIQGLNQKLEAEVRSKDARIGELEKRLSAIEALLQN